MLEINDAFSLNQDLQRCGDKKESRAITVKDFAFSRWRDRILRILCEKKNLSGYSRSLSGLLLSHILAVKLIL